MGLWRAIISFFSALGRLFAPALLLSGAYGLALALQGERITLLDPFVEGAPGQWLTPAHIAIMLAFFVSMLSNRAHGPAFAFGQLLLCWIALGGAVFYLAAHPEFGLTPPPVQGAPETLPFLGALFAAHLINIVVYDAMRGKPWWRAPLTGGLAAAIALPAIHWTLTRDAETPWLTPMTIDFAVKAVTGLVLLVPFAMLRGATRPRNGFGGY